MNKQLSILMVMMMIAAPLAAMPIAVGGAELPAATPFAGGNFGGGNGTVWAPYIVEDVDDLQNMSANVSAHYILGNDIDASETLTWNGGQGFVPIGSGATKFTGTLDGQNFTINNLYINRPSENYVSLLGYTNDGFLVQNTNLLNVDVTGKSYVGGLVGALYVGSPPGDSKVMNCSVHGDVSGTSSVGVLVGWSYYGQIVSSYSTGHVTSSINQAGGLVGQSQSSILSNSYSLAEVDSPQDTGGFIGKVSGTTTITNCYSTGSVAGSSTTGGFIGNIVAGTITNCFWDNETSGQTSSAGEGPGAVEGKNTTEMLNNFTYTNAGWDFDNIWFSVNESTRPFLRMEWNTTIRSSHQVQLMIMDLTADYTLANDIDMDITNPASIWGTSMANGQGFLPIGNSSEWFAGSFEGNEYTMSGLFINRSSESNIGLLGRIVTPAEITNITLTNVNVSGGENAAALVGYSAGGTVKNCHVACEIWGYGNFVGGLMGYNSLGSVDNSSFDGNVTANVNYVGGLIGRSTGPVTYCTSGGTVIGAGWTGGLIGDTLNSGSVENSTSSSIVDGNSNVGGLIGRSGRPVDNSSASGDVSGGTSVGGLVGFNANDIDNSNSSGAVSGNQNIGGLVGANNGGTVENCHAASIVNGTGYGVGGLVGWDNDGMISNSSASGNVNGSNDAGGLVGYNEGSSVLMNCSASGNVNGDDSIGGLVGANYGSTSNSYATGTVTGNESVGGLVGANDKTVSNCSSNGTVIGAGDCVGGLIGYSSDAPVINSTSFGDVSNHYPGIGNNYGTGGLIGKLDSSNVSFCKAFGNVNGTKFFTGGLIGHIVSGAIVMNCSAHGVIKAFGSYIGGLVGRNEGTIINSSTYGDTGEANIHAFVGGFVGDNNGLGVIQNSSAHGDVLGGSQIGGFVGQNTGLIERCFSMGSVDANDKVGGFVGMNGLGSDGNIIDCYSQGNVIGDDRVGGFVGNHTTGSLTNVYSTGLVTGITNVGGLVGINWTSTVTNSHWDIDTSGQGTSAGGEGNTTEEMMRQTTFDPPWDFTNIWGIYENNTYPFLRAFGIPPPPVADLEITIDGTPEPCNVGDVLMYTVTVTNNGPDLSINPVVNITLPAEVTWLNDSQSIGPPTGLYLETAIGSLASGESGGSFINVSVDSYTATITATARIDNVTTDSNLTNNIDWANTTINRVPIAGDDDYQTTEDYIQTVNAPGILNNDFDPDVDPLTVISHEPSDYGANVTVFANGSFVYDPTVSSVLQGLHNGESLDDTFNYTISDGRGGTATALITIQVDGNDDPPTANNDTFTIDEDSGPNTLDVLANDVGDEEGDDFFITHGSGATHGTLTVSADGQTLIYEQTHTNYTGYDVFTYMISDGNATDTASVNLTISPVNDAPLAQGGVYWVNEDSGPNTLYVLAAAIDAEGDDLTITAVTQPDNGTVVITESGKNLTYEPDADFFGNDYFNYTISDGNGGTDSMTVTVKVNNTNDDPVITTVSLPDGLVGGDYTFTLTRTDIDSNTQIWSGTSSASWLTIGSNGVLSGTPTAAGSFWVNIELSDGAGGTDTANLTLIVTGIADDMDGDGIPDATDPDIDGDGVDNAEDAFPEDAAETVDTDGDGIGNNADTDDDGDGIPDTEDDNPLVPADTGGSNTWLYVILILVIVGAIAGFLLMRGKGAKPAEEPEAIEEADSMGSAESVEGSDGTAPEDDIEDLTLE